MSSDMHKTPFAHPTPELPVEDVQRAQRHYRDALGFDIAWILPDGELGAADPSERHGAR